VSEGGTQRRLCGPLIPDITTIIEDRGLTQIEAAAIMGINQPKVSALARSRLAGFSFERLARYLMALGQDVEIVIRSTSDRGHLRVREESTT
jgi:predicted XRE-type DNA-binding protein